MVDSTNVRVHANGCLWPAGRCGLTNVVRYFDSQCRTVPPQADLLPDPADVFKFLHANRIGEDVAYLYMAWAWVAEVRA